MSLCWPWNLGVQGLPAGVSPTVTMAMTITVCGDGGRGGCAGWQVTRGSGCVPTHLGCTMLMNEASQCSLAPRTPHAWDPKLRSHPH